MTSASAGVVLVVVLDSVVLPLIQAEEVKLNRRAFLPVPGVPSSYRTWWPGPRQATITRALGAFSGNSTAGPVSLKASLSPLTAMLRGLVQEIFLAPISPVA